MRQGEAEGAEAPNGSSPVPSDSARTETGLWIGAYTACKDPDVLVPGEVTGCTGQIRFGIGSVSRCRGRSGSTDRGGQPVRAPVPTQATSVRAMQTALPDMTGALPPVYAVGMTFGPFNTPDVGGQESSCEVEAGGVGCGFYSPPPSLPEERRSAGLLLAGVLRKKTPGHSRSSPRSRARAARVS